MDFFFMMFSLLFVVWLGASETAVSGAELSTLGTGAASGGEKPPPSSPWRSRSRRTKRCSCSSLLDKECVYFCHLDIIWVYTPEQVVPYGLGSPSGNPSRPKRSLKDLFHTKTTDLRTRCQCASQKDKKCSDFCQAGKELKTQDTMKKGWNNSKRGKDYFKLGKWFIHQHLLEGRKIRRLESIGNSIKPSFRASSSNDKLHQDQKVTHNRTH